MANTYYSSILTLAVLLYISGISYAQSDKEYFFRNIKGLSENNVLAIHEDQLGYIWIGTKNGLNRFNGSQYDIFEPLKNDTTSLLHPYSHAITETRAGDLWVLTRGGISRYIREIGHFDNSSLNLTNTDVYDIYCDQNDRVWIANNGIDVINALTLEVENRYLEGEPIRTIFEDSKDRKWFIGRNKVFLMDSGKKPQQLIEEEFRINITEITEDSYGNIWLSIRPKGLLKLTPSTDGQYLDTLYQPNQHRNSLHSGNILALESDQEGHVWVGMENGGLDILDVQSDFFAHYQPDKYDDQSLSSNSIWTIKRDQNNHMWIGSYDKGIDIYDPYQKPFKKKSNRELSGIAISTFAEDSKGNIWIGADGYGMDYFDVERKTYTHYEHSPNNANSLANNAVLKLVVDAKDNVLIGSWEGGLTYFDVAKNKFTHYVNDLNDPESIAGNSIFSIKQDQLNPDGFWVSTWAEGLGYFDLNTKKFKHIRSDETEESPAITPYIRTMEYDLDGNLWLGTNGGVYRLNTKTHHTTGFWKMAAEGSGLTENNIYCMKATKNGVWIGTQNAGLNLYLPSDNSFLYYDKYNGLPSNGIKSIEEDDKGNLWVGTAKGLVKLEITGTGKTTQVAMTVYDQADGLESDFFNLGASLKARSGELYFGGSNGYNNFIPQAIGINPLPPHVILSDFKIYNKKIHPSNQQNAILSKSIEVVDEIHLDYTHQVFSIDFIALNFTRPEKNEYAYFMEGVDQNWNYVGNQTSATYTTLPPGTYTFKVKASNNDGVWNKEGTSVIIEISPPWWKTWVFKGLLISLIVLLIIGYMNWRTSSLRREQKILEERVKIRTAKIEELNNDLTENNHELTELNARLIVQKEELQTALDELSEARNRLAISEKMASLGVFTAGIAHEINNPINFISGATQKLFEILSEEKNKTLLNKNGNGEIVSNLQRIVKIGIQRTTDIIRSLKNYSHQSSERIGPYNIVHSLDDALMILSHKIKEKQIIVERNHPDELSIKCVPGKLSQVFINILSNAIDALQENGTIQIDMKKVFEKEIEISIADSGEGIDEEEIPKLFDPFYTTKEVGKGTGLGLYLIYGIIEQYQGRISVKSKKGKGTTFTINFPIDPKTKTSF